MMNVKYTGPALDYSGYGEANRHDIAALHSAGIDVQVELTRHVLEIADLGQLGQQVQSDAQKQLEYEHKILHTTPNIYGNFIEPGKYHIGRVFWETDRIPAEFARGAEFCDEIWTGSEFNAQAIRNAGVSKPIYIIPEAIAISDNQYEPFIAENKKDGIYNFYAIFEWTERKNPLALIEAYWREFEHVEGVALTIKTYVDNFNYEKRQEIDQDINRLKTKLKLSRYAPLYLFRNLMDRNQIYRLHATYDCYVSAHRGEGWGIPQMEALLSGNAVISTACGGIHEHLTDKKDALLVPYELVPLKANSRNRQWYTQEQKWAEVNVEALRASMRWVFDNQDKAKLIGKAGRETVKAKFSPEAVGRKMRDRLERI